MDFIKTIKDIIIYKEPKEKYVFELLEDEEEETCGVEPDKLFQPISQDTAQCSDENENSDNNKKSEQSPKRLINSLKKILKRGKQDETQKETSNEDTGQIQAAPGDISDDLKENLKRIKREFHYPTNKDIVIREFRILQKTDAFIVYVDGMANNTTVNDYILRQLMNGRHVSGYPKFDVDYIADNLIAVNEVTKKKDFNEVIGQVTDGLTALFVEGNDECIVIETRGYEKRSVSEPISEAVIRGPQEGFNENLRTNLSLLRKIIRNKDFITEILPLGKAKNSTCAVLYIEGLTNKKIVQEIKRRVSGVDLDYVSGAGTVEQLIEDRPSSIYPQMLATERPDKTAMFLLNGKVAIICDGSPFASIAPVTFFHFFKSAEDTELRWQFASFLRIIRWFAGLISILLPGLYAALTLFHWEMIPSELLATLTLARENVPLPTLLELLIMELTFELIREGGLRVPGAIGQTLGIIGAIVLGQAGVAAGLVSPILIMVVALTGLSSFAIPNFSISFSLRIMRFAFIIFGGVLGFYGIAAGIILFMGLACSIKSFGVPYLSPIAPKTKSLHDVGIITAPHTLTKRPDYLNTQDRSKTSGLVRGWEGQSGGSGK